MRVLLEQDLEITNILQELAFMLLQSLLLPQKGMKSSERGRRKTEYTERKKKKGRSEVSK